MSRYIVVCSILLFGLLHQNAACKKDIPPTPNPNWSDTTSGWRCHSDTIYYTLDIQPILTTNCALSGCHDAISSAKNIDLTKYEKVMKEVTPYQPDDSELYEYLQDPDPRKRMPPPPRNPLSSQQIDLIRRWILSGANNYNCNPYKR